MTPFKSKTSTGSRSGSIPSAGPITKVGARGQGSGAHLDWIAGEMSSSVLEWEDRAVGELTGDACSSWYKHKVSYSFVDI